MNKIRPVLRLDEKTFNTIVERAESENKKVGEVISQMLMEVIADGKNHREKDY